MSALLASLAQLLWGFAAVGATVLIVVAARHARADLRAERRTDLPTRPFVPEQRR